MAGFTHLRGNLLHVPSIKAIVPWTTDRIGMATLDIYFHESDRMRIRYGVTKSHAEGCVKDAKDLLRKSHLYQKATKDITSKRVIPRVSNPCYVFDLSSVAGYHADKTYRGYPYLYLRMYQNNDYRTLQYPGNDPRMWDLFWNDLHMFQTLSSQLLERWSEVDETLNSTQETKQLV